MVFPVIMYGRESWTVKKAERWRWCFWTVVLEKTLESPLDCKEIKPGNPKGNQSWIFIRRTDTEAEVPILWPPDTKEWLIGKDLDAGKDWRQEEKGMTEDEMVGWHHQLNGHEFEQASGVGDGQAGLACCCPWGSRQSEWLNNNDSKFHTLSTPLSRLNFYWSVQSIFAEEEHGTRVKWNQVWWRNIPIKKQVDKWRYSLSPKSCTPQMCKI